MASDEQSMQRAAETLQGKMMAFVQTLTPEEGQILSRTLRAAAEQAGVAQASEVEGYDTSGHTIYFFFYHTTF